MNDLLEFLIQERPVGTDCNNKVVAVLETKLTEMGYTIKSLPFECKVWQYGISFIKVGDIQFEIEPSPFSEFFSGNRRLCTAKTVEALQDIECQGAILILTGEITQAPLSPKNYPFYYPDEHKKIITLLEQKQPAAIIAVTGSSPLHGKNPFYFFEDGNFLIPSANISQYIYENIVTHINTGIATAELTINSYTKASHSRQIVASTKSNKSKGKIIIGAHMDSKYDTPGALDNATGVAVLLEVAANIDTSIYNVDIVPFNSEEYYGANGELEYFKLLGDEKVVLMINIDSPCHINSKTAISLYNVDETIQNIADKIMLTNANVVRGNEWYAGDHAPFVFRNIPCLVATSSNLFDGALKYTHTSKDTIESIEIGLIKYTAKYLLKVILELSLCERKRTRQLER